MESCLVVIDHSPVCRLADIVQAVKQMPTKHFFPERTVEALDIGSLVRLARPDLLDGHTTVLASTSICRASRLKSSTTSKVRNWRRQPKPKPRSSWPDRHYLGPVSGNYSTCTPNWALALRYSIGISVVPHHYRKVAYPMTDSPLHASHFEAKSKEAQQH